MGFGGLKCLKCTNTVIGGIGGKDWRNFYGEFGFIQVRNSPFFVADTPLLFQIGLLDRKS